MSQLIPVRRGFDRFTSEPELGPVEFEMALDIEEQARVSEQNKLSLRGTLAMMNGDCDGHEGNLSRESPMAENSSSSFSPRKLGRLTPNPEFIFPLESYHGEFEGSGDMDPMKRPPQPRPETVGNDSQPQTPSQCFSNKSGQSYSHRRLVSEAESYIMHWENGILYDKDTNTRVSTSGFFQSRSEYKSPYLGPVGWTVPSKYYSTTTRSSSRATNTYGAYGGYNDNATTDINPGSPRERTQDKKMAYNYRGSRPFLIYQDPEWIVPPRGVTDAYFDSIASDDKENSAPDDGETRYGGEGPGGESIMQTQNERPEPGDGSDGDNEMDMDNNDGLTTILPELLRREPHRRRQRRNAGSISSSSTF
ncbi:hypothetical protein MaudCBS49596_002162 [Microsporum audouinii]